MEKRTRIKLFNLPFTDNHEWGEKEVDNFMEIIVLGGDEIVDVKLSSAETSFNIMVIYKTDEKEKN